MALDKPKGQTEIALSHLQGIDPSLKGPEKQIAKTLGQMLTGRNEPDWEQIKQTPQYGTEIYFADCHSTPEAITALFRKIGDNNQARVNSAWNIITQQPWAAGKPKEDLYRLAVHLASPHLVKKARFLGDLVGYGPNPTEAVKIFRHGIEGLVEGTETPEQHTTQSLTIPRIELLVAGNHDIAMARYVQFMHENPNTILDQAILFLRRQCKLSSPATKAILHNYQQLFHGHDPIKLMEIGASNANYAGEERQKQVQRVLEDCMKEFESKIGFFKGANLKALHDIFQQATTKLSEQTETSQIIEAVQNWLFLKQFAEMGARATGKIHGQPAIFCHDNPLHPYGTDHKDEAAYIALQTDGFRPGMYFTPEQVREELSKKGLTADKVKFIIYGHSHIPRNGTTDQGTQIHGTGSTAGMNRNKELGEKGYYLTARTLDGKTTFTTSTFDFPVAQVRIQYGNATIGKETLDDPYDKIHTVGIVREQ